MLFHRGNKGEPGQHNRPNSTAKVTGPGPEWEDMDSRTVPITYPNKRYSKAKAAVPSDEDVEEAKDWVDFNTK